MLFFLISGPVLAKSILSYTPFSQADKEKMFQVSYLINPRWSVRYIREIFFTSTREMNWKDRSRIGMTGETGFFRFAQRRVGGIAQRKRLFAIDVRRQAGAATE